MDYSQTQPRRRRWPVFVPVGLVLVLAVVWSGLWFYAAAMAEKGIATWRAREAAAGRSYECDNQAISGFPFRIELKCAAVSAELRSTMPPMAFKAGDALFAWQIYQPTLVLGEVAAPLAIGAPGQPAGYLANWTLARASVRGTPGAIERVSVAIDEPSFARAGAIDKPQFTATHGELHGRMAGGSINDNPIVDLVLRLSAAKAPEWHRLTVEATDAEIAATVRGLADLRPKPLQARLRELQSRGGSVEVSNFRVQQGEVIATGAGTLAISARGNLDGQMQVTIVGIEQVLKMLDLERIMSEGNIGARIDRLDRIMPGLSDLARRNAAPGIIAGLGALGQRTTLEGKPAVTVPLRFNDGNVMLGPLNVGRLPPLL